MVLNFKKENFFYDPPRSLTDFAPFSLVLFYLCAKLVKDRLLIIAKTQIYNSIKLCVLPVG